MTDPAPAPVSAAQPFRLVKSDHAIGSLAPRGSWWWFTGHGNEAPRSVATWGVKIKCGGCEFVGTLHDAHDQPNRADGTHGHHVDAGGVVQPSIVCPMCGWHTWGILEGWDGGDTDSDSAAVTVPAAPADPPTAPAATPTPAPDGDSVQPAAEAGATIHSTGVVSAAASDFPVANAAKLPLMQAIWKCDHCQHEPPANYSPKDQPTHLKRFQLLDHGAKAQEPKPVCPFCFKGTLRMVHREVKG